MMNGGPVSGKSRRQDNISLSTSEAEFVAASQAKPGKRPFTFVRPSKILATVTNKKPSLKSMKTICHVMH